MSGFQKYFWAFMKPRSCASSDQSPARPATQPATPDAPLRRSSTFSRACLAWRSACALRVAAPLRRVCWRVLRLLCRGRVVALSLRSPRTAILIASMPLMVAGLSARFSPAGPPTGLRLVGLLVGLVGVVALLGVDVGGRGEELLGAGLVLAATLCYATAPIIVERRLT